jgi:NADH:ubiquinone oxidoreductase subunit 6 (subunit J)
VLENLNQIATLGKGLYTYGATWLIITSLILLLSMVSAIIISISDSDKK